MSRMFCRLYPVVIFLALFTLYPSPSVAADPLPPSSHTTPNLQSSAVTRSSAGEITQPSGDLSVSASVGGAAFALELYPGEWARYIPNVDVPETWVDVGSIKDSAYYAGDFVGRDYSRIFVIDYSLNEVHTLNTRTGITTTIGACSPLSGHVWTGATGTADGILYASSTNDVTSYLYTVNTWTGAATAVGEITNAAVIIDIAINVDGVMYGVDITNDTLVRIDPTTGAGTVVGPIGFDADYAQGMDFEESSGLLYLAAYNVGVSSGRGELRTASMTTGSSTLVGVFPDDAEVTVLAFTPAPTQYLQNPGYEGGWANWQTQSAPILSNTYSHSGSWSVMLSGQECWVWQDAVIPADALDVSLGYWITGVSFDPDFDNDLVCGSIWDWTFQTEYVDVCFGLAYFYSYPGVWRQRIYRLDAGELASVAGKYVKVAFRLTQDWNPGYHKVSTGYVDDTMLYVTRPIYDYSVYLPLALRQ